MIMDKSLYLTIPLDGEWDFTYTPQMDENMKLPGDEDFTARMPVPGYWDDNAERMQTSEFWSAKARFNPDFRHIDFPMGDNMPPDASLPYLLGVGWYKKMVDVPREFSGRQIALCVGGVILEAWVWINGVFLGHHLGHSTSFEFPVGERLKYGAKNEIIIAVSNTRTDRLGCIIRGFKGFSAGIYRPVELKIAGGARIADCYVHPADGGIKWNVRLEGDSAGMVLDWQVREPKMGVLGGGSLSAGEKTLEWTTETFGMREWSEHTPNLYEIEITLRNNGAVSDSLKQSFGLRTLERKGVGLYINGRSVILRGATEHAYFPLTCTAPSDKGVYRDNIRKLKALGFNWLRFHTWVPSEEYMQAADELGIMLQVEAPLGFEEGEWLDILYACRKHPSVVIYCCGNEEMLDDEKIERLRIMAAHCRRVTPDALFNPHEALRGVEYHFIEPGIEEKMLQKPFPHHPERLAKLKEFSDVFGQYPLGLLSYDSVHGDWRTLDERLAIYERPCLSHENGIHGNYLNLDLEHRYEGTRIGTEMFASVRRNLKKEGLLHRAALYYENSCAWMRILRKHNIENNRKCKYNAGYDLLGAIDYHWHRCGYPCGIMNEFYEMKPGESVSDVLQYNGESLVLADCTNNRNLNCGDSISIDLYSSLFGRESLREGNVYWYFAGGGNVYQRGEEKLENIQNGVIQKIAVAKFNAPEVLQAQKVTLYVRISGGEYEISNNWDFWVFPKPEKTIDENIRVISALGEEEIKFIASGGSAVLLGGKPFPVIPTSFQLAVTGRVQGNLATVIEDHPLMKNFPHEGFCDWQFYSMVDEGEAAVFGETDIPFKPIIEVVSSFKLIRKQASLFEMRIGEGKLLVCTLNISEGDPAAMYLLGEMTAYAKSEDFNPEVEVKPSDIIKLLGADVNIRYNFSTDEALDPNVKK